MDNIHEGNNALIINGGKKSNRGIIVLGPTVAQQILDSTKSSSSRALPLKTVQSFATNLMKKWHTVLYKLVLLSWGETGTQGYSFTKFCAKILPLASHP